MKKIAALLMAIALFAVVCPAVFADNVSARSVSVTYTGATVNATNLSVSGKFQFTISVSENSHMWSGHWLIDYPEEYVTPTNYSVTWSGGLIALINQSWDNDSADSDKPMFVVNMDYEGMTGQNPYGEAGNMYSVVGMYLTTFQYWGVMDGGPFARITYRIDRLPTTAEAQHDAGGYYLEFPITVLESRYWVEGVSIAPENDYYHDHETVNVIPGKVYMQAVQSTAHTVTFYGFNGQVVSTQQVEDGAAATAPSVPAIINNSNGSYRFYGWDADFSHVTSDMSIHAEYILIGDTDLNGTVNSADALLAQRYALHLNTLNDRQIFAGDVSRDGTLNSADALTILRYSMGVLGSLA
ncbi:MAG: dockerin type I repeat-containing protein [Clostridia bacterium]|nr:dockerin type I repeat-containing protein [Clostridia bacterium]